jgi:hypothetical protein
LSSEGKGFGEIEDLSEPAPSHLGIDRRRAGREPQLESSGGSDPEQSVRARLAVPAEIRVDHGTGHAGAARKLGLAQPAPAMDLADQGGSRGRHGGHVSEFANTRLTDR